MPSKSSPAFLGLTPATKHARPLAYARLVCVWNCPVLPVMPCVITRVFLSIRMLIDFPDPLIRGSRAAGERGVSDFLKPPGASRHPYQGGKGKNSFLSFHRSHHFLGCFTHVVCRDDRQA